VDRPSCQSSLLSDPNPNFSVEMWRKSNMRRAATSALTQFYGLLTKEARWKITWRFVEMGNFAGFAAPVLGGSFCAGPAATGIR
jgi:hypothetical protein